MTGLDERTCADVPPQARELLTPLAPTATGERTCAEPAPPAPKLLLHPADRLAHELADRIEAASTALGRTVRLDGPATLRERTALEGLPPPGGTTSPGGGCHLLRCADGWLAISLARTSDLDLLPAWLALAGSPFDVTPTAVDDLRPLVAPLEGRALADAAALVGLPVGVLGEVEVDAGDGTTVQDLGPRTVEHPIRVLDLSALWAGSLCARTLGLAGATVTKVESTHRPDASRIGNPHLFAALNGTKAQAAVNLTTTAGVDELRTIIRASDVVVESSRPRALELLGIVALDELRAPGGPSVWVSITGHGRSSPRVAFGDDAAIAGGLVRWDDGEPRFAGDALADPLAGLAGAAAALEALTAGRSALIDVPLAAVAAAAARR
ncbi:MAG: CoA transferase [Acidimicrobiales bacterium]|nr:CoA transferase [Acidimicrobiales bacterium]HRW37466.1 CoA transferase [Aquihabitans sp.]